jgi:hypothetical protein
MKLNGISNDVYCRTAIGYYDHNVNLLGNIKICDVSPSDIL